MTQIKSSAALEQPPFSELTDRSASFVSEPLEQPLDLVNLQPLSVHTLGSIVMTLSFSEEGAIPELGYEVAGMFLRHDSTPAWDQARSLLITK